MNPIILYKYRRWDNSVESSLLRKGEIFYSNPLLHGAGNELTLQYGFDISYEQVLALILTQLNVDQSNETIEYLAKKSFENIKNSIEHQKSINGRLNAQIDKNFSIFSMSEVKDSKVLWERFSGYYTGYCVGIDIWHMHNKSDIYGGHIPILYYSDYKKEYLKLGSGENVQKQLQLLPIKFESEREIRFFKAYISKNVLSIPREIVKEIIIGNYMNENAKNEIIEIKKMFYPHARLQVAKYIEDGYFTFTDL